jgi:nucleoside-diphosphate-sugar epimerase
MKVLVLGATGYIGHHVASAFRRAGHDVWGLVRSPDEVNLLEIDEMHAVVGDLQRPESYRVVADMCDVLVQTAMSNGGNAEALDELTVMTLLEAARSAEQPRTIVYTGGSWDYGDTGGRLVDETAPVRPVRATAWRPDHERQLLESRDVRVVVIRPGNVYGRGGGITGLWFAAATSGKPFEVVGTGDNHWAMVHVDDLAEGYLRAAESGLSSEIFNFTDGTNQLVRDMVEAVVEAAAYRGKVRFVAEREAEQTMGLMAEALALDFAVDATKATRMLNWRPRHCGFSAEAATYLRAWQAAQATQAEDRPRRAA